MEMSKEENSDLSESRQQICAYSPVSDFSEGELEESDESPVVKGKKRKEDSGNSANADSHDASRRWYSCQVCEKNFTSRTEHCLHLYHTHNLAACCAFCGRHETCTEELVKHTKRAHEAFTTTIECWFCEMVFDQRFKFWIHVKSEHRGRYFKCRPCGHISFGQLTFNAHEKFCTRNALTPFNEVWPIRKSFHGRRRRHRPSRIRKRYIDYDRAEASSTEDEEAKEPSQASISSIPLPPDDTEVVDEKKPMETQSENPEQHSICPELLASWNKFLKDPRVQKMVQEGNMESLLALYMKRPASTQQTNVNMQPVGSNWTHVFSSPYGQYCSTQCVSQYGMNVNVSKKENRWDQAIMQEEPPKKVQKFEEVPEMQSSTSSAKMVQEDQSKKLAVQRAEMPTKVDTDDLLGSIMSSMNRISRSAGRAAANDQKLQMLKARLSKKMTKIPMKKKSAGKAQVSAMKTDTQKHVNKQEKKEAQPVVEKVHKKAQLKHPVSIPVDKLPQWKEQKRKELASVRTRLSLENAEKLVQEHESLEEEAKKLVIVDKTEEVPLQFLPPKKRCLKMWLDGTK